MKPQYFSSHYLYSGSWRYPLPKIGLWILLVMLSLCIEGIAAETQEQQKNSHSLQAQTPLNATEEGFAYRLENRKDPFAPFLTPKSTSNTATVDEIVAPCGEFTGMQLFEPGQLNLVALLETNTEKFAMVEDVTGKGYIIHKGTKIGKRGVIKAIIPNKVIIEEVAFTRSGKKIVTETVMVLKKEGEE